MFLNLINPDKEPRKEDSRQQRDDKPSFFGENNPSDFEELKDRNERFQRLL